MNSPAFDRSHSISPGDGYHAGMPSRKRTASAESQVEPVAEAAKRVKPKSKAIDVESQPMAAVPKESQPNAAAPTEARTSAAAVAIAWIGGARRPTDPVFAVAGNPPAFFESAHGKDRLGGPTWLSEIGLDGLEISCTHGVNVSADRAAVYRTNATAAGIGLFVHAPYYVSLASGDAGIVARSQERIVESMTLAVQVGASRVVFHPGGHPDKGPGGREAALARLIDNLRAIPVSWDPAKVRLCAETGGKTAALGSLDEIIEICRAVDWLSPCIDFAHQHARTVGGLPDVPAHVKLIETLRRELGEAHVRNLHCHVYTVAFNDKGERFHLGFEPDGSITGGEGGPDVRHFLAAVRQTGIVPSVVCESRDSQDVGARLMKRWWREGVWGLG